MVNGATYCELRRLSLRKENMMELSEREKPIVALSCDIDEEGRIRLLQAYVHALWMAGGIPVLMPPLTERKDIEEWLRTVGASGVVLTGGADIEPLRFGEDPIPELGRVSVQRDESELMLFREALKLGLPVLGICRGLQVINVACGGSLIQDMRTQLSEEYSMHDQKIPTQQPVHHVCLDSESEAASLFETGSLWTNSHHHQCVERVGNGLVVVGRSDDGVVEALESPAMNTVAVQFHPERMVDVRPEMARFFENWLSKKCKKV